MARVLSLEPEYEYGARSLLIWRLTLTCGLFLATLQTYYFYGLGIAPFPLVGLLILYIVASIYSGQLLPFVRSTGSVVLIVLAVMLVATGTVLSGAHGYDFMPARLLTPVVAVAAALAVPTLLRFDAYGLFRAIRIVLGVHVFFFLLQFGVFMTTGHMIDFLAPVTGEEQRVWSGDYAVGFMSEFARCAGLFNEPGTYANFVFPLFLASKMLSEEMTQQRTKLSWLDGLVLLTMLLSFSMFGIGFLLIWLLTGLLLQMSAGRLVLMCLVFLVGWVLVGDYVFQRFSQGGEEQGGLGFRLEIVDRLGETTNVVSAVFGQGFVADLADIYPELVLNDVGVIVYVFIVGGLLSVGLLVLAFASGVIKAPRTRLALALVVTVSKLSLTFPMFWFFAFLIVSPAPDAHRRRHVY